MAKRLTKAEQRDQIGSIAKANKSAGASKKYVKQIQGASKRVKNRKSK